MGYIYKITNKINNKIYIGQTSRDINTRWTEHIRDSFVSSNSYSSILHAAIRKYGIDTFIIEEIEKCDNSQLNTQEEYWIEYYDSCNNGYNISHGGGGYLKCSDEEILTLWQTGLSAGEIADKLDLCNDTVSRRLKDCNVTQEEIIKRGRKITGIKNKKPVYKYDLNGNFIEEFANLELAEQSIGGIKIKFPPDYVSPIGGFQWRRIKVDKINSIYDKSTNKSNKPVYQYDLDGNYITFYNSITEAAKTVNLKNIISMRNVCNGKNKTAGKYRWSYVKLDKLEPIELNKRVRPVIRINLNTLEETYYPSINAAAKDNNTASPDIIHVCKGTRLSMKGYAWRYADEILKSNIGHTERR